MVVIITVVKDEDDIVEDWLLHHSALVGCDNIWVLDNGSTDNTWNILERWRRTGGIHIGRLPNYRDKGLACTEIMRKQYLSKIARKDSSGNGNSLRGEFVIPLDIDEFLVLLDPCVDADIDANKEKNGKKEEWRIRCTNADLLGYLRTLPVFAGVYKMAYLNAIVPSKDGLLDATAETLWAQYSHIGNNCKSFVYFPLFRGEFDHGNHMPSTPFHMTRLALIHFHTRNTEQQKKKTANNLTGLGYPANSLTELSALLARSGTSLMGFHHIETQIRILNGTYTLPHMSEEEVQAKQKEEREQHVQPRFGHTGPIVSLTPFSVRIQKCRKLWAER